VASEPTAGSAGAPGVKTAVAQGAPGAATDDITFAFDTRVAAGEEHLRCLYAQIPTDRGDVAIGSVDSRYTPGSHHLLAYRSNLTAIPEGKEGVWSCDDGAWQVNQRGSYYEAQQPEEHRELPEGIAHVFKPGEVLIVQAHYINVTQRDLAAHVEMTLHPVAASTVEQEAGTIFFSNINISVPPHGTGNATMSCELPQDITLALLWSHMHKRGTHFIVETDDAAAADVLGTLYEEHDWAEPKERAYPTDTILHKGTHITFSCEYQNDGDATYHFGNSAEHDEMCILHGMYWPRMPNFYEQCLLGTTSRNGG
jgi:hypothetical protein